MTARRDWRNSFMEETQLTGKHYFTRAQNLFINFTVGRKELVDGELRQVEDKSAQFAPIGDGFGRFYTDDPVLIRHMDKRVQEVGDIFGPEEYSRVSIPAERRADMLERELKQKNELIEKLLREGKLKK